MTDMNTEVVDEAFDAEDTQKDKYLTFRLAEEEYAIEIRFVVEIIGIQRITEVPDSEPFVRGVINLRGKIIPVIDVRLRFNLQERPYDDRTCIIIVEFEDTMVGLIVDEVSEVMDIPAEQVSDPPKTFKGNKGRYIQGLGRVGEEVKMILEIWTLLSDKQRLPAAEAA